MRAFILFNSTKKLHFSSFIGLLLRCTQMLCTWVYIRTQWHERPVAQSREESSRVQTGKKTEEEAAGETCDKGQTLTSPRTSLSCAQHHLDCCGYLRYSYWALCWVQTTSYFCPLRRTLHHITWLLPDQSYLIVVHVLSDVIRGQVLVQVHNECVRREKMTMSSVLFSSSRHSTPTSFLFHLTINSVVLVVVLIYSKVGLCSFPSVMKTPCSPSCSPSAFTQLRIMATLSLAVWFNVLWAAAMTVNTDTIGLLPDHLLLISSSGAALCCKSVPGLSR